MKTDISQTHSSQNYVFCFRESWPAVQAPAKNGMRKVRRRVSLSPQRKYPELGLTYAELLDEDVEHGGSDTSNQIASQINLYLSEPLLPRSRQPLAFW